MGKQLNKKVHKFFKFDPNDNKSACIVCGVKLSGTHSTNLKRHLTSKHAGIFNDWDTDNESGNEQTEIPKNIFYQTSERVIVSSLIKIYATYGKEFLDGEGFTEIMDPIYNSLGMNPITSQTIMNIIPAVEMKVRNTSATSDDENESNVPKNSSMSLLGANESTEQSMNMLNNDESTINSITSLSDSNGLTKMEVSELTDVLEPSSTKLLNIDKCYNSPIPNSKNIHKSPSGSPKAKRKKSKLTDNNGNTIIHNNVNRLTNQGRNGEEMRSYYYSKYVGQCLDMLDPDLNLEAREKINEILQNTERVQLNRS